MSEAYRANRKATDKELIQFNNLGLSLKAIGEIVGCHPTTVKIRLGDLGIAPADTRRSFMGDIYESLSPTNREWLMRKMQGTTSIKEMVTQLIRDAHLEEAMQKTQD